MTSHRQGITSSGLRPVLTRWSSAARAIVLASGVALLGAGCSAETEGAEEDVAATDDALLEQFLRLHGKGVWVGMPLEREYVTAALPPELELVDASPAVPVIMFFNRIKIEKFGGIPADLVTPDWNEFVYLVPNVRFRGASECAPDARTTFNYLVYNYLTNPIGVKVLRTLYSLNRGQADIRFDDARLNATLNDAVQLSSRRVGPPSTMSDDAALRTTWEKPAIALGAKKKFVRYVPTWANTQFAPLAGDLKIRSSDFLGLPPRTFTFEPGTPVRGYQVDAQITLDRFVQCDGPT